MGNRPHSRDLTQMANFDQKGTSMKTRKPRSDSITAVIFAIENTRKPLPEPPAQMILRDSDRPFWDAIITGRAYEEWTAVTLVLAVQLARTQADIEQETATLVAEGSILDGKVNPRCQVIDVLEKRQMALLRTLRMGGTALGKTPTIENGRALELQARGFQDDFDDLIAR